MEDVKAGPATKEPTGFSLKSKGSKITLYRVGKQTKVLNHSDKETEWDGKKIPVATQEQLREVYDADATYAKFVNAPAGHTAPWEKK